MDIKVVDNIINCAVTPINGAWNRWVTLTEDVPCTLIYYLWVWIHQLRMQS